MNRKTCLLIQQLYRHRFYQYELVRTETINALCCNILLFWDIHVTLVSSSKTVIKVCFKLFCKRQI